MLLNNTGYSTIHNFDGDWAPWKSWEVYSGRRGQRCGRNRDGDERRRIAPSYLKLLLATAGVEIHSVIFAHTKGSQYFEGANIHGWWRLVIPNLRKSKMGSIMDHGKHVEDNEIRKTRNDDLNFLS